MDVEAMICYLEIQIPESKLWKMHVRWNPVYEFGATKNNVKKYWKRHQSLIFRILTSRLTKSINLQKTGKTSANISSSKILKKE